jgi:hypothetical protein
MLLASPSSPSRALRSPGPAGGEHSGRPLAPAGRREAFVATPSFVWGELPAGDPTVLMRHRRPTRRPPPIDNRPSFKVRRERAWTRERESEGRSVGGRVGGQWRGEREWTGWAHTGAGNALAFKQPT